jgi:hypothetical protein
MIRIFQISDETFWGYRVLVDLTRFSSLKDITDYVKADLVAFLRSRNLSDLAEKASSLKMHIHEDPSYEELLKSETVQYLCTGGVCLTV